MTWATFYAMVAGFANRSNADLTVNGIDFVMQCANMAKTEAQRRFDFKMARTVGFLNLTPAAPSASIQSVATVSDGVTSPVPLKKLEATWTWSNNSYGIPTKARYIPIVSKGDQRIFYPNINSYGINVKTAPQTYPLSQSYVYLQGFNLYCIGQTVPSSLWMDMIQILPDYTGSNTDFFLTYHADWLILKTLDYMNLLLKEDQRIPISTQKMELAWNNVTAFDDTWQDDSDDEDALN